MNGVSRKEFTLLCLGLSVVGFGATSLALLAVGQPESVTVGRYAESWRRFLPILAWFCLCGIAFGCHVWLNRRLPERDPILLPVTLLLAGIGLLIIARVAPNFLWRQILWLVVGSAALCGLVARQDGLRWLRRFKYTWLILALLLLAATLILGVNPSGYGARLWLNVLGAFLQPSEVLRLLMIAFLAAFLSERQEHLQPDGAFKLRGLLVSIAPSVLMWGAGALLLFSQQDLGAALLLVLSFVVMLYLSTGRRRLAAFGLASLLVAGVLGHALSARVAGRIDSWIDPWRDAQNSSFQIVQSLIAVANGGVFGQGLGQGHPGYVPAVHTDFPFAVISEELGLAGGLAVLTLYAVLTLRGMRIARDSASPYTRLLAGGLSATLALQTMVIVGGNIRLLPLTGVTLPLVSYGGSSLVTSLIIVALLLRMSHDSRNSPPRFIPATLSQVEAAPIRQVSTALSAAFACLGLLCGWWSIAQSAALTGRSDNPRLVDDELAIDRGAILDRNGAALAHSAPGLIDGQLVFTRTYGPPAAPSAVGYYSLRYGLSGIEAYSDATLRGGGTMLDALLHRPQVGAAVTTTLDGALQTQLTAAMSGLTGAGLIIDAQTGGVLAMVSQPTFDSSHLDRDWELLAADSGAPLLNRITQGVYQPGALLRLFSGLPVAPVAADGGALRRNPAEPLPTTSFAAIEQLKLDQPVPFELPNSSLALSLTQPGPASPTYSDTIGQGRLRITPLRAAVAAARAYYGVSITPTLLLAQEGRYAAAAAAAGPPDIVTAQQSLGTDVVWVVDRRGSRLIVIAIEVAAGQDFPPHPGAPRASLNDRLAMIQLAR